MQTYSEIRQGAYFDSVILMRLQGALADLPGVDDAGAMMGTEANLAILDAAGLLPEGLEELRGEDLLVVVRAEDETAAQEALDRIDELLAHRGADAEDEDFRPRSLRTALRRLPEANWVTVSVPGAYAARVARQALERDLNVFLYSDNVSLEDEVALKRLAAERRLLVLGPDCGTAAVGGVGLGFANRVRQGRIGLIAASGTGLQTVMSHLHRRGLGVRHAIGTGGRDLSLEVGAATTLQALELLAADPGTEAIGLISKPPSPEVAARVLSAAREAGKPVVVHFSGAHLPHERWGNIELAPGLAATARRLVGRLEEKSLAAPPEERVQGHLRALFTGGTLALETLSQLRLTLSPLTSNLTMTGVSKLPDPHLSEGHTVVDLGADELTVGRPHPMIDPEPLIARLRREAEDPATGVLLVDAVLGDGSHGDPAALLAPVLAEIRERRPELRLAVVLIGTELDPQGLETQRERLEESGARVFEDAASAAAFIAGGWLRCAAPEAVGMESWRGAEPRVLNVGLESFYDSLLAQEAPAVHVAWRPPAGGDEALVSLLDKML